MPEPWPRQLPNQIVRVAGWQIHDDHGVFPQGTKPKSLLICPDDLPHPFLIPGHAYMFKKSITGWRENQIWSEVIAYEMAKICGVHVPPCFVALNEKTGEVGALIEFFYGYPDETLETRFITGTDILQRRVRNYNAATGRPHQIPLNIAVCRVFRAPSPHIWWAKSTVFDALIGNTDRHAENWGLLRMSTDAQSPPSWKLAPAYDNGTSLGYEIREDDLGKSCEPAMIEKRLERGRHHTTWSASMLPNGDRFSDLSRDFARAYPLAKRTLLGVIPTPDAPIRELLQWCTQFDLPLRFTEARATFVEILVRERSKLSLAELEG